MGWSPQAARRRAQAGLAAVAGGWVLTRLAALALGVRFDLTPLNWFWQFADPQWLRHDLIRTLFYLHGQPPLFNAYLGAGLKLGSLAPVFFAGTFMLAGLLLSLTLYVLALRLGLNPAAAVVVALVHAVSPAAVLYENWLFYTLPAAFLLAAAGLALAWYADTGASGAALTLAGLLAALVLTRSAFHPVWMLLVLGLCWWVRPDGRRRLVQAAAVPLLLVILVVVKNAVLFGMVGTSSWTGMNLARLTTHNLSPAQRQSMLSSGQLEPAAAVPPFSLPERYPQGTFPPPPPEGEVPVLHRLYKAGQAVNYNHTGYLAVSAACGRSSRAVIREYPAVYLRSIGRAWLLFLNPSTAYWPLDGNRRHLAAWERGWQAVVLGVPAAWRDGGRPDRASAISLAQHAGWLWALVLVAGVGWGVSRVRRGRLREAALPLYLAGTVLWVAILGNSVELGENHRFRALVDPLALLLAGAAFTAWSGRGRRTCPLPASPEVQTPR